MDIREDESHLDKIEEEMSAFQDLCHRTSGKIVKVYSFYSITSKSQGFIVHPNPDIEKIDVANHEDLERFF